MPNAVRVAQLPTEQTGGHNVLEQDRKWPAVRYWVDAYLRGQVARQGGQCQTIGRHFPVAGARS